MSIDLAVRTELAKHGVTGSNDLSALDALTDGQLIALARRLASLLLSRRTPEDDALACRLLNATVA